MPPLYPGTAGSHPDRARRRLPPAIAAGAERL